MKDKDEKFIRGNKDININGWKLLQYMDYPSGYKPYLIYHLAYWKNGKILEETEEFFDSKIIAMDFYNSERS